MLRVLKTGRLTDVGGAKLGHVRERGLFMYHTSQVACGNEFMGDDPSYYFWQQACRTAVIVHAVSLKPWKPALPSKR